MSWSFATGETGKVPLQVLAAAVAAIIMMVAAIGFPVLAAGEVSEVAVLVSDEYGLTLQVSLPDFSIQEKRLSVGFSGSDHAGSSDAEGSCREIALAEWASTSSAGHPQLPVRAVLIEVPPSGQFTVEVLDSTAATLPDVALCTVPWLTISDDGRPVSQDFRDVSVYQTSEFFPENLVEVSPRSFFRGTAVARIMIHPFQWNPVTGELRYFTKLSLGVRFEEPLPAFSQPLLGTGTADGESFERLKYRSILNYSGSANGVSPMAESSRPSAEADLLSGTVSDRLKIEITKTGIYRLAYKNLAGAGVSPDAVDPRTFKLFNRDQEVAIKVVSKVPGSFQGGDYLEFYAEGGGTEFTDTRVYWLRWGGASGKRTGKINGKVTGNGKKRGSFKEVLRFEENHVLWDGTPGAPEKDYWFWEKITAPKTRDYTLTVPSPLAGQAGATISAGYQGRSTASPHPDHHTRLGLNGTVLSNQRWDGDSEHLQKVKIKAGLLKHGANKVTLTAPADTGATTDVIYLNWLEIAYTRALEAVANRLSFTVDGNDTYRMEVGKFTKASIRIYDVTDPNRVKEVTPFSVTTVTSGHKAIFEDVVVGTKAFYAVATAAIGPPPEVTLWKPENLRGTFREADLILITDKEFLAAVEPLCTFHRSQGLRVQKVDTEEIYNTFSNGQMDPAAIREFLKVAYARWKPPAPAYVLLVGDASIDYRDYLGTGKKNRVPTHLSFTANLGLTPDDNWFACVDGNDSLPDLFIGRIPASSPEAVAAAVKKILAYEKSTTYYPKRALFVADNNDPGFEELNKSLIAKLPARYDVHKVYLRLYGSTDNATRDIQAGLDEGMLITTYAGHGDVTGWAGERIFETGDVPSLTNSTKLTFMNLLTCLNGYFAQPYYYSLAEEFVVRPGKGAAAAFAPSGLGYLWEHEILGKELFSSIFKKGNKLFGVITTESKINAFARGASEDILKTYTLFGDPAGRVRRK